jgi:hypothetical protein
MLKTLKDGRLWLVTQPDHGRVAGYLAAHWGNDQFTPPGSYASVPEPGRLRAETIFAVAQHDNGWWEWEAAPDLAEADGLPLDLAEVLRDPAAGMERWRKGLSRYPNKPTCCSAAMPTGCMPSGRCRIRTRLLDSALLEGLAGNAVSGQPSRAAQFRCRIGTTPGAMDGNVARGRRDGGLD